MRSLIAIAALVASVSASAGELDGKAIFCERPGYDRPNIVEFRDGNTVSWSIGVEGTQAVVKEYVGHAPSANYKVSPTAITWDSVAVFENRLDLETLELVTTLYSEGKPHDSPTIWQCEVVSSLDNLQKMLEELREAKQAEIDQQMKNNKI